MKTSTLAVAQTKLSARIIITQILSIVLAIGGIHHGFFEILQGNTPTNALFIESIGEGQRMWLYGNDGAFTLIPNFLITGIVAITISIIIIIWSLFYINKRRGVTIIFLLFIALTLSGGGIGHIPFFLLVWVYGTKIRPSISRWQKVVPINVIVFLSKTWFYATFLSGLFFLIGLEISVFGFVPTLSSPDEILAVCWSFLFASLLLLNYSYIAGYAFDIRRQE